jgi:hypothetical protein
MADQEKKPLQDITGKEILSDEELENVAGGRPIAGKAGRLGAADNCAGCGTRPQSAANYVSAN